MPKRMEIHVLILTDLPTVEINDALNETLRRIALDADLASDPETGGYVGLDWSYDERTAPPDVAQHNAEETQS